MIAVSVVIPVFNAAQHLEKSRESLLHQTIPNCEFIFVNDGSTDDSVAFISKLIQNDALFKLFVNKKNGSYDFAKKRCIELTTGKIF